MEVQINWVAVLLAAVASMVVGAVWYAKPVFGTMWGKLVKLDDKKMGEGAVKGMAIAFIAAVITAYVLAHVAFISEYFFGVSFFQSAVQTAFWLWLGISATTIVTHNAFEQRPRMLTLLAVGFQLVSLLVMGVVIGWLQP